MNEALFGSGKLTVRWEPDKVEGGSTPPAFTAEMRCRELEVDVVQDPVEGPFNGMWREYVGTIFRSVSWTAYPLLLSNPMSPALIL